MAINGRLQRLFDQTRSSYAVFSHGEAFTAQEVAQSVRVKGDQLAKVVIVRDGAGKDFMVVLPATRHFDPHALHQVTGGTGFRLEDEQEIERLFPDCEVGAMPPFGSLYGMPMHVDPCLLQGGDIFFQAGNHHEVVLMRRKEYEELARPFYAGTCLHRESGRDRETTAAFRPGVRVAGKERAREVVMTPNVGGIDRAFRIAVGVAAIGAGVYFRSWWGALGAIPLLTGILRWCPVYLPSGTSTFEARPKAHA